MKSTLAAGAGCTLATITLAQVNEILGCLVGIASLAAFVPLAIQRWQRMLAHKKVESANPFKNE